MSFLSNIFTRTYFLYLVAIVVVSSIFLVIDGGYSFFSSKIGKDVIPVVTPRTALASYQYAPTAGPIIIGTATGTNATYLNSWRGAIGNDGNYWNVARTASGLDIQLQFDGVELHGANKLLVTMEDTNQNTASAYVHQICDWISSTGVDNTTDAQCTGGGWRTLQPRKTAYTTNNTDTTRTYEIYDGYFSTRTTVPGAAISTPLSNFIEPTNSRVLVRASSTVSGTQEIRIDYARVEAAIDPVYEPTGFATTSASSTMTGFISDLVGAVFTGVTGSDGNKMTIPVVNGSTPADFYFSFTNVETLEGMNTILVQPEICASNVALVFNIYLYNFNTAEWTKGGATTTPTLCATDTEYGFSFNDTFVPGFSLNDYISNGEVRVRLLTGAPGTAYNLQIDRIYLMVGSVNTDTSLCEISFGTGTETNCDRTRSMGEGIIATPTTTTWQATTEPEYPADHYPTDNDDDGGAGEQAHSQNLSFPMIVATNTAITGIHYAVKFRSGTTTIQNDLQLKKYGGLSGLGGEGAGGQWFSTPGTDANAATTYSFFDTWRITEQEVSPDDMVDTRNNLMNLRLRTSASTNASVNTSTNNWDFAMVSVRWVEESRRTTITTQYGPTGGPIITGTATTTSSTSVNSWRGAIGNDGNYWAIARTASGLDVQLQFDDVELHGANKLLVTMEDTNHNTASAYVHQICDWISSTGVDNATDAQCTGGGWRTLQPRKTAYTTNNSDTTRTYEIYDGYFSTRVTAPGSAIDTPLSNFIEPTNDRVLVRASSSVSGTQELRIDYARVEVAIDPIYEPTGFATTSASSTMAGFISDVVGPVFTNLNGSDANKMTITMATTSEPIDVYYTFENVKTLDGMNTILVQPEICANHVGFVFNVYLYNFGTAEWTRGGATTTPTLCATDTEYGYSFNDAFIPGFDIDDHISNGEVRFRILTLATTTIRNLQIDRLYMMVGSVNADTSLCEISFGTGTETDCDRTRSMGEGITATPTTTTWQATTEPEYPADHYPTDNDDDATNNEQAHAQNLSFPMTIATNTAITGIHYAVKFRSATTTIQNDLQLKKYGGLSGLGGEGAGGQWFSTPGTDANALTTYSFFDTWRITEQEVSPEDMVDTYNNLMNLRLRTSASTNASVNTSTNDWDFAMVSVRWVDKYPPKYISFALSDNTIGFGPLSSAEARYATGDLLGSLTDDTAHTLRVSTNAGDGYSVLIDGSTLTCSACNAEVTPIGATPTATLVGTEQFGMRVGLTSGTGTTTSPYDTALFAFATSSFPDQVASGNGDEYTSTYDMHYIANISSDTDAGAYSSVVTYIVTGMY